MRPCVVQLPRLGNEEGAGGPHRQSRLGGVSWPDILADLDSLTETEVEQDGKRFLLRRHAPPPTSPRAPLASSCRQPCGSSPTPDPVRPAVNHRKCSANPLFRNGLCRFINTLQIWTVEDQLNLVGAMAALQTVLPFKLAATDRSLTAHGGLALVGEYLRAMGVALLQRRRDRLARPFSGSVRQRSH